jgi:hypothetical protein
LVIRSAILVVLVGDSGEEGDAIIMETDGVVVESIRATIPIWEVRGGRRRRQDRGMGEEGKTTIPGARDGQRQIRQGGGFLGRTALGERLLTGGMYIWGVRRRMGLV